MLGAMYDTRKSFIAWNYGAVNDISLAKALPSEKCPFINFSASLVEYTFHSFTGALSIWAHRHRHFNFG